jgi:hypothetical protein
MHALPHRISYWHTPGVKGTSTHKDPIANIKISATLFFNESCNLASCGIGNEIIIKSSNITAAAPEYTRPFELIHLAFRLRSQTAWMGLHWKVMARVKPRVSVEMMKMVSLTRRRKRSEGKMRR